MGTRGDMIMKVMKEHPDDLLSTGDICTLLKNEGYDLSVSSASVALNSLSRWRFVAQEGMRYNPLNHRMEKVWKYAN